MDIEWTKYFDHIYCISYLPEHKTRFDRINNELKRVGILDSGIFEYKFTTDNLVNKYILKETSRICSEFCTTFGPLQIALAHYEIYKNAYYLDYNKILILEEDIMFLKNIMTMKYVLDAMPKSDVVLLDKFSFYTTNK